MTIEAQRVQDFVDYVHTLKGDEKGEAQVFCDRLFQAFGHKGFKEAGATLEERVQIKNADGKLKSTKFADLVWKPRVVIEMKKRGANLQKHYAQVFSYWEQLVPNRPRYAILCNFDEFWIYDFDTQLDEPMDKVALDEMPRRLLSFNFLFPALRTPHFRNNRVSVTRSAATKVGEVFRSLEKKHKDRAASQRFVLQCVVAMFSEDVGLLPNGVFSQIIADCQTNKESSYDLFYGLFRQMNEPQRASGGRFENVAYFNGGLFSQISSFNLGKDHINGLDQAASEDWSKVQPAIFGTLFQASMDVDARHALGAHFTSEIDINRVVGPTIVYPWRERIENAATFDELLKLQREMRAYRVLDPSCGSGNFLYIAYRKLKQLETELLQKLFEADTLRATKEISPTDLVSTQQFFGLDIDEFAVEVAKVTMMIAKEMAAQETLAQIESGALPIPANLEKSLPLDNLDDNIRCDDALFCDWPHVDAIIGNPPYQSKNKMQAEYGAAYVNKVREKYPDVPGRADYCVYWFRRAHNELAANGRAGLVGTNTIRQNYSREGGLDYIVGNGGTIHEAVSTEVWSGDAAVHVSIVNWIKGEYSKSKTLWTQIGDNASGDWHKDELSFIPSSLSAGTDVTQAQRLRVNMDSGCCYQGQTHGHEGFLLAPHEARQMIKQNARNREVLFPYLIAEDLLGQKDSQPTHWVIDFGQRDIFSAQSYKEPFAQVEKRVLPTVQTNADNEKLQSGKTIGPRQSHLKNWWKFWRPRGEMLSRIAQLPRYIVCGRVTKRPIFEFVSPDIRPNDAVMVFALSDEYSFGILQSSVHWLWFKERCSTMKGDFRYTSDSVWDTFVWPQSPTLAQVERVAQAAKTLRTLRREIMTKNDLSLREVGRILDKPGKNPIRDAQDLLDRAVRDAYGMKQSDDVLAFLLQLNAQMKAREENGEVVVAPGLPPCVSDASLFLSDDCLTPLSDLE